MKTDFGSKCQLVIIAFIIVSTGMLIAQTSGERFNYKDNSRIDTKTNRTAAMYNISSRIYSGTPEQIARQFLNENKKQLDIPDVNDLKLIRTINSPAAKHIGFLQTHLGVPIFKSEIVVSINNENRVSMVISGGSSISSVDNIVPLINKTGATKNAVEHVNADEKTFVEKPTAELYFYRDSVEHLSLAWKINFVAGNPYGDWQVFIDANRGTVIESKNIAMRYVNGSGKVFKTRSGNSIAKYFLNGPK